MHAPQLCIKLQLGIAYRLTICQRTLLVSQAKLDESIALVNAFKAGNVRVDQPGGPAMADVWDAKKVVDSTIHPGIHLIQSVENIAKS